MNTLASDRSRLLADDAIRRRGHRWRGGTSIVVVIAGLAVAGVLLLGRGGGTSPLAVSSARNGFSVGGLPLHIGLDVRTATANFSYDTSSVVDDGVPTLGARVLDAWIVPPADRQTQGTIIAVIVGRGVIAVRARGLGTFPTLHVPGLPAGYKATVFIDPRSPALAPVRARTRDQLKLLTRERSRQLAGLVNRLSLKAIR